MGEILLTVDTATPAGSVALTREETLLGEVLLHVKGTHTDRVLVTARQLLADTGVALEAVKGFAVVIGPGAFTGLRVGVATVKGLALATGRPVIGVSSLQTLALQAPFSRFPVCALLDARKKEVYAGLFDTAGGFPSPLGKEAVLPPEKLLEGLSGPVLFVGDGAVAYRTLIVRQMGSRAHFVPWTHNLPRASQAAGLALNAWRQGETIPLERLSPRYIRASEAEILWARRAREGCIEG
jgi:tRNA threonylcarbamoyladenosine biosynthesis protein TsaB